jgi:hypothetical protein
MLLSPANSIAPIFSQRGKGRAGELDPECGRHTLLLRDLGGVLRLGRATAHLGRRQLQLADGGRALPLGLSRQRQ